MKIHLVAVGKKMPAWVNEAYQEYARRLPPSCQLLLHEVSSKFRGKNPDVKRLLRAEGESLLAAVPPRSHIVALDPGGKAVSTPELAQLLDDWMGGGQDVALLVGGPEGLCPECLSRAHRKLSLSRLTFPHPLVRVIVAEAIYRAWSLNTGHPYHRA